MSRQKSQFKEIINLLTQLHNDYPSYSLGRHISTAFADYGDIWGLSDKEFLFAIEKYKLQLEIGFIPETDESLNNIIKDATENLFDINEEDEEY